MKYETYFRRSQLRRIARPSTAVLLAAMAATTLNADVFTYNGAATADGQPDTEWTTDGNWMTGAAPSGDVAAATTPGIVRFNTDRQGAWRITEIDDIENVNYIVFNSMSSGYTFVGGATWQFKDSDAGGGVVNAGEENIQNNSGQTQVIESVKMTSAAGIFSIASGANSTTELRGDINFNKVLYVTGEGTTKIAYAGSTEADAEIKKEGDGTLVISGNNTDLLAGTKTTLNAGTLLFGHNTAIGSSELTINGGSIGADGDERAISNKVFVKSDFGVGGTQTLNLSGIVDMGDPAVGNAVPEFRTLTMTGGTLKFTGQVIATDQVAAPGVPTPQTNVGLNINGSGEVIIDTDQFDLEGDLNVNGATLNIGDQLQSAKVKGNVIVTNGTVKGDGLIEKNLTLNGSTLLLEANNSTESVDPATQDILVNNPAPKSLTIAGNLTLGATDTIVVEVKDNYDKDRNANYELLGRRNGVALVGGDIDIHADAKIQVNIQNSESVRHGDVIKVIDHVGGGAPTINYGIDVDDVSFTLPREFEIALNKTNDLDIVVSMRDFATIALTENEKAVATAFQHERVNLTAGSDMEAAMNDFLKMGTGEINDALQTLTPEEAADKMVTMGFHGAKAQNSNVNARLNDLRYGTELWSSHTQNYFSAIMNQKINPEDAYDIALQTSQYFEDQAVIAQDTFDPDMMDRVGFFVTGYGTFGEVGNEGDKVGYDWETYGATIGMDYRLNDELIVGAYTGYSYSEAKILRGSGSSNVNSFSGGVYASYQKDGSYLSGSAGLGYNLYDNNRNIKFGTALDRTAKSDPTGLQFTAAGTIGHDFKAREWVFGPYAQVEFAKLTVEDYEETGAGALNLKVEEMDLKSLLGRVGAHVGVNIDLDRITFMPEAHAAYQHQFYDTEQSLTARFAGGTGGSFNFDTRELTENAGILGVGFTAMNRESGNSLYLFYDGEFGENEYTIHTFRGGMRFTF